MFISLDLAQKIVRGDSRSRTCCLKFFQADVATFVTQSLTTSGISITISGIRIYYHGKEKKYCSEANPPQAIISMESSAAARAEAKGRKRRTKNMLLQAPGNDLRMVLVDD